jgi:enoyl-CoA hydratase/carnithine racemase
MPVTLQVRDDVAHVTLDRYAKRNALDESMLIELTETMETVSRDAGVRAVVLRGSNGFFCAGADITEWANPTTEEADRLSRIGTTAFNVVAACPAPTVAVVERSALGGGLELALAADLRFTTDNATFGYPEAGLGNLPSWGGIARLVDTVGLAHTKALFLTARPITGRQAETIGLVTSAAPEGELEPLLRRTLADILACDPWALRTVKDALAGFAHRQPLEHALAAMFSQSPASQERKRTFLARRNPDLTATERTFASDSSASGETP